MFCCVSIRSLNIIYEVTNKYFRYKNLCIFNYHHQKIYSDHFEHLVVLMYHQSMTQRTLFWQNLSTLKKYCAQK